MSGNEVDVIAAGFRHRRAEDPPCYYSILQNVYIHQDSKTKEWIFLSEAHHKIYLRSEIGLCNKIDGSENGTPVSDVDWDMMQSRKEHRVEAAFDFDGWHQGIISLGGKKYLNIGGTSLPQPFEGIFPRIEETILRFFGQNIPALVFQGVVQHPYKNVIECESTSKIPVIFIGDSREEGMHVQDFFALLLGGRSCHYSSDKLDHKTLLASALWRVDRISAFPQSASKAKFFNQFLTGDEVLFRANSEFHVIPCFAQKSIFLKKGARELLDLHELSTEYNVHVLPLLPLNGYRFEMKAVQEELPYFMAYLTGKPALWKGKYVAPELDQFLFEASPTGHFYAWLLEYASDLNSGNHPIKKIQSLYSNLPTGDLHREMFKRDKANFPIYLEELSRRYPEQIKRVGKSADWKFNLPKHDNEQQSEFDN